MEELLLPRLSLDRISTFQRPRGSVRGQITEAGWPLLIDALHVRPSELSAVIGGEATTAGKLLQVYLDLPWFDTLSQARAVAASARQSASDAEQAARAQDAIRAADTARVREELRQARTVLAAMDDERRIAARLRYLLEQARALAAAELRAAAQVRAATTDLADAEETALAARRASRNIAEKEAAGAFFRALEPQACPRCAAPIDDERRARETAAHICSVCSREAQYEPDPTARTRAETQVTSTAAAVDSARRVLADVQAEYETAEKERTDVEQGISRLTDSQALARLRAQEAVVYRLEGRIEESEASVRRLQRVTTSPDQTVTVLQAAEKEAEARVKQSAVLFDQLNEEVLALGQRFGIVGLTRVKVNRAAHLDVTKEGTEYNFGRLSDGDKLRLKVALVIGLLRVGHRRGASRHPGLLFVDAPGAEEVASGSLREMVSGLVEVADQLGLQVVIATQRLDDVQAVLSAGHLLTPAEGRTTLW